MSYAVGRIPTHRQISPSLSGIRIGSFGVAPPSSRAAGKLGYVLLKCLGGELQPLDRGQVGENRCAEILDGHAVFDGERRGLNGIRTLRRQNMRAEELAASGFGHKLDQPARIARARYLLKSENGSLHRKPVGAGLRFGEADACDLRIGEDDGGHSGIVVNETIAVERIEGRNL